MAQPTTAHMPQIDDSTMADMSANNSNAQINNQTVALSENDVTSDLVQGPYQPIPYTPRDVEIRMKWEARKILMGYFLTLVVTSTLFAGFLLEDSSFLLVLPVCLAGSIFIDALAFFCIKPVNRNEAKKQRLSFCFEVFDKGCRIFSTVILCLVVSKDMWFYCAIPIPMSLSLIIEMLFFFFLHNSPGCISVIMDVVFFSFRVDYD